MQIVPFNREHLSTIKLQPMQAGLLDSMTDEACTVLENSVISFTALDGDVVLACAGICPYWDNRAHAWALLSDGLGSRMIRIHRAVKRAIETSGYRRIEMVVDEAHAEAMAWAVMLGFKDETPNGMPYYTNDGRLYHQFARIS